MMRRREFLEVSTLALVASPIVSALGCRAHQFGHVIDPHQQDMVGSHAAGAETFNRLIDESVAKLLGRQEMQMASISTAAMPPGSMQTASMQTEICPPGGCPPTPKRICFVGVENCSAEELGDFKEQIYEQIDSQILQSPTFEPVSRRFVDAALHQTRLRPDALFLPDNRRMFASALEQQGQPFDYLLYAKLTSGTTEKNKDYQRDYLLTLEMINVHTGQYDKESAKIRKGYHKSRLGKWRNYNPFTTRG